MRLLRVVALIVLLIVLNVVNGDMHEYISNIPSDFGSSVNNAWNNIVKAIKRPVRIRRLGRTGRTKMPKTTADLTTRYLIKLTHAHHHHVTTPMAPSTTTKTRTRLIIPILREPSWRMFDWRNGKDISNDVGGLKEQETKPDHFPACERTSNINKMSEENDSQHYGNLFFI